MRDIQILEFLCRKRQIRYIYSVIHIKNKKQLIKKEDPPHKNYYFTFQISKEEEERNGIITRDIFYEQIKGIEFDKKKEILMNETFEGKFFHKGKKYIMEVLQNDLEYVEKADLNEVHATLQNRVEIAVLDGEVDEEIKAKYQQEVYLKEFKNIDELIKYIHSKSRNEYERKFCKYCLTIVLPSTQFVSEILEESIDFSVIFYGPSQKLKNKNCNKIFENILDAIQFILQSLSSEGHSFPTLSLATSDPLKQQNKNAIYHWMLLPQNLNSACEDFIEFALESEFKEEVETVEEDLRKDAPKFVVSSIKIIQWYTKESFFHKLLNKSLKILQNPTHVVYIRYIFGCLFRAIQEIFYEQRYRQYRKKGFKCYRGCSLNFNQIKLLQENIGEYIQLEGFISTSSQQNQALRFMFNSGKEKKNPDQKCLIQIDVHPTGEPSIFMNGFAWIRNYSTIRTQNEILFNPNIYKIIKIQEKEQQLKQYIKISLQLYQYISLVKQPQQKDQNLRRLKSLEFQKQFLLNSHLTSRKSYLKTLRNQGDLYHFISGYKSKKQWFTDMLIWTINKMKSNGENLKLTKATLIQTETKKSPLLQLVRNQIDLSPSQLIEFINHISSGSHLIIKLISQHNFPPEKNIALYEQYMKLCKVDYRRKIFIYFELFKNLKALGRYEQAEQIIMEARKIGRQNYGHITTFQEFQSLKMLGQMYKEQKRFQLAIQIFKEGANLVNDNLIHINTTKGAYHHQMAETYLQEQKYKEAQQQFKIAEAIVGEMEGSTFGYKSILINYGMLHYQCGRFQQAWKKWVLTSFLPHKILTIKSYFSDYQNKKRKF